MTNQLDRFERTLRVTDGATGAQLLLTVSAAADATNAALGESLARRFGLKGERGVLLWNDRVRLDPADRILWSPLTESERLTLVDPDVDVPLAPSLSREPEFVLIHEDGRQMGVAWPLSKGGIDLMRGEDGYWVPAGLADYSHLHIEVGDDPETSVIVSSTHSGVRLHSGSRTFTSAAFGDGSTFTVSGKKGAWDGTFRLSNYEDFQRTRNRFGKLSFRVKPRTFDPSLQDPEVFDLEAFPVEDRPEFSWPTILLQAAPAAAMIFVLSVATRFQLVYLIMLPIYLLVPYITQLLSFRKARARYLERRRAWSANADRQTGALVRRVEQERDVIRRRQEEMDFLVADAFRRNGQLWSKGPDDADFLHVAVGRGIYRSESRIRHQPMPAEMAPPWQAHFEESQQAPDTPIEHSLAERHLAVVGEQGPRDRFATAFLHRVLLTHSPARLTVVVLLPEHSRTSYEWMALWPHVSSVGSGWSGERFVVGVEQVRAVLEGLESPAASIKEGREHILLLVHEGAGMPVSLLGDLAAEASPYVHVVWIGSGWASVPRYLSTWVEVESESHARIMPAGLDISFTALPRELTFQTAEAVTALVDETATGATQSAIPARVPIGSVVDPRNGYWWDSAKDSLRATFFVDQAGAPEFDFDQEGPHILVGGMSGSGKSELLKGLIGSLCVRYAPSELALLLVDFKGGASLKPFVSVPHCVGMVSNLSDLEVDRFIEFMRGELLRRQELLADVGEYSDYRGRPHRKSLPRLLVVIDEFASFVVDSPRREAAIIEIAQKGRSLGIHLVLATQSPASAVTQAIRDNVGARFSLRTADALASERILGVTAAARIPASAKGRMFALLSDSKIHEYQSVVLNGNSLKSRSGNQADVAIIDGAVSTDVAVLGGKGNRDDDDLAFLARFLATAPSPAPSRRKLVDQPDFTASLASQPPKNFVWPPPGHEIAPSLGAVVGIADRPRQQTQDVRQVDWNEFSVVVVGEPGSGRTSLMQSLTVQALRQFPMHRVVVVDAGSTRSSAGWEKWFTGPGVSVVTSDVVPATVQLIEQLTLYTADPVPGAHCTVVIDRLDLVAAGLTDEQLSRLARLVSSGARAGVHFVASVDSRTRAPAALLTAFPHRFDAVPGERWLLTEDEGLTTTRMIRMDLETHDELPLEVADTALPIGPVGIERRHDIASRFSSRDRILIGIDSVRHNAAGAAVTEPLVVTGATQQRRTSLMTSYVEQLVRLGGRLGGVGAIPPTAGLIDLAEEVCAPGSYRKYGAETVEELVDALIAAHELTHIVVFESTQLDRLTRPVFKASTDRLGAYTEFLSAVRSLPTRGSAALTVWSTSQIPPFDDVSFGQTQRLENANWVYLDPRPESLIPGGFSAARSYVAGQPGRQYSPDQAVGMLGSSRVELDGVGLAPAKRPRRKTGP